MSVFFHRHNVKFSKVKLIILKNLKQMKTLTQLKLDNSILITQSFLKDTDCLSVCAYFSKSTDFTIGMIGNETGHLLKCVRLYRKRNIAATSLKISCTNLYSVKSYDETNMKVFALSLLGKLIRGLTYFDEFILKNKSDVKFS